MILVTGGLENIGYRPLIELQNEAMPLRYFNPLGTQSSAHIGMLPLGVPQNLALFFTQTAIGLWNQLSVFGDDYHSSDGTCIRDCVDVVDLAKARVEALRPLYKNENESNYEVFNLGTRKGGSVLEVTHGFECISEAKLNYRIVDRRKGDVVQAYADTTKANILLGWKTESTLDQAVLSAWGWEIELRN